VGNGVTASNDNQINIGNSTYNEIILTNRGPTGPTGIEGPKSYTFVDGLLILPQTIRPSTGPTGSICFDQADQKLYFYDGLTWNNLY